MDADTPHADRPPARTTPTPTEMAEAAGDASEGPTPSAPPTTPRSDSQDTTKRKKRPHGEIEEPSGASPDSDSDQGGSEITIAIGLPFKCSDCGDVHPFPNILVGNGSRLEPQPRGPDTSSERRAMTMPAVLEGHGRDPTQPPPAPVYSFDVLRQAAALGQPQLTQYLNTGVPPPPPMLARQPQPSSAQQDAPSPRPGRQAPPDPLSPEQMVRAQLQMMLNIYQATQQMGLSGSAPQPAVRPPFAQPPPQSQPRLPSPSQPPTARQPGPPTFPLQSYSQAPLPSAMFPPAPVQPPSLSTLMGFESKYSLVLDGSAMTQQLAELVHPMFGVVPVDAEHGLVRLGTRANGSGGSQTLVLAPYTRKGDGSLTATLPGHVNVAGGTVVTTVTTVFRPSHAAPSEGSANDK